jgi:hypothetical protein
VHRLGFAVVLAGELCGEIDLLAFGQGLPACAFSVLFRSELEIEDCLGAGDSVLAMGAIQLPVTESRAAGLGADAEFPCAAEDLGCIGVLEDFDCDVVGELAFCV